MQQHYHIRRLLKTSIDCIASNISQYVDAPNRDFSRNRTISAGQLVLFLLQIGVKCTCNELHAFFDNMGKSPTVSAMCQQRDKLKPEAMFDLFRRFTMGLYQMGGRPPKWQFVAVDGCRVSFNAWRNEKSGRWTVTQGSRRRQEWHIVSLFDLNRRYMVDAVAQPVREQNEREAMYTMIERFRPITSAKPVFLADRGFPAWNSVARIEQCCCHYLFRITDQGTHGSMLNVLELPSDSLYDVTLQLRLVRSKKLAEEAEPNPMRMVVLVRKNSRFDAIPYGSTETMDLDMRVIRYRLPKQNTASDDSAEYGCIITNLPVKSFSTSKIVQLYARRWKIETAHGHEKSSLGLENFHAVKPTLVLQEIWAKLALYNYVTVMQHFAQVAADQNARAKRSASKREGKTTQYRYIVKYSSAAYAAMEWLRLLRSDPDKRKDDLLTRLSRETYAERTVREPTPRGNTRRRITVPLTHRSAV